MNEENAAAQAAVPAVVDGTHESVVSDKHQELARVWMAAGPTVQRVADAAIGALERSTQHIGVITGVLLGMILLCFSGLAFYALYLGRVDTAEKLMIALISFLGGAAMFSGAPKK